MCEIYTDKCTCPNCTEGCTGEVIDLQGIIDKIFKECDEYRATLNLPPHNPENPYCDKELCFSTCPF